VRANLDYAVVVTGDGVRHARVRDVPVLLCGRDAGPGAREEAGAEFDCPDCAREAELRGDNRAIGVVDA
jgi:hypothetical protein